MLFQESALFDSLTIEENVAYPLLNQQVHPDPAANEVRPRVQEALRFVELEHTLEKFPSELPAACAAASAIARAVVTEAAAAAVRFAHGRPRSRSRRTPSWRCIIKERDVANTTTLIVTHRYQDGNLMANFRYNPDEWAVGTSSRRGRLQAHTNFMVMREGRLVFEGTGRASKRPRIPTSRSS